MAKATKSLVERLEEIINRKYNAVKEKIVAHLRRNIKYIFDACHISDEISELESLEAELKTLENKSGIAHSAECNAEYALENAINYLDCASDEEDFKRRKTELDKLYTDFINASEAKVNANAESKQIRERKESVLLSIRQKLEEQGAYLVRTREWSDIASGIIEYHPAVIKIDQERYNAIDKLILTAATVDAQEVVKQIQELDPDKYVTSFQLQLTA